MALKVKTKIGVIHEGYMNIFKVYIVKYHAQSSPLIYINQNKNTET